MGIRQVSEAKGCGPCLLLCLDTPHAHLSWSHAGTQSSGWLNYPGPGTQGPPTFVQKVQDIRKNIYMHLYKSANETNTIQVGCAS